MLPLTYARASQNKLEKVGPTGMSSFIFDLLFDSDLTARSIFTDLVHFKCSLHLCFTIVYV